MKRFLFSGILAFSIIFAIHAEENVIIAIAGDSTVASYKYKHYLAGWGQVIDKFFKNADIKNFAASGRSTRTFIAEKKWEQLLESKPQFILLQFGHNDSHGPSRPESTDAASDYKEYLRQYIDDARKSGAEIIFITPMHRRLFKKDGKMTMELLRYANAMKEVAKEKNITCIDLYTSSGILFESLGDEGAAPLFSKAEGQQESRTHFSPAGAEKIAELIVDDLKKSESGIVKYLK